MMPLLDLPSAHFVDNDTLLEIPEVAIAQLNGEEDDDKLSAIASNVLAKRDFLYTIAVMCAPADGDKISAAINAISSWQAEEIVRAFVDAGIPLSADADVALSFAGREDWKPVISQLLNSSWLAGLASGYVLRWVVSRWQQSETRSEASLTRAIGVIEEWCRTNRVGGGGTENIKKHLWPKYKSVSHLWAAWFILQDVDVDLMTPDGLSEFFSTAHCLLQKAAAIVPKRRRVGEAFLSIDEAWQIPPAFVRRISLRTEDGEEKDIGSVGAWIDDPDAHDIRKNRIAGEESKVKKAKLPKRKGQPTKKPG